MRIFLWSIAAILLAAVIFFTGHDAGFTLGYHVGYGDRDLGYYEGYSLEATK